MKRISLAPVILCACVAVASDAAAQSAAWNNGFVSINSLYQSTPITFNTTAKLDVNREAGEVRTDHRIAPGLVYDVTAGGKIKGNLGVMYALAYRRQTELGQVSATLPHPFYFNQPRLVAGTASLKHQHVAMHVAAMWLVPVSDAVQVSLFGGPTYFRVMQDMVGNVEARDVYPFDQAEFTGATSSPEHASRFGYHAGADVSVFFTRTVGVGGLVRFSRGTVDMPSPDGETASMKVGGMQAGAGLRVRF